MAAGQPKPAFYVAVGVVVLALIAFAFWLANRLRVRRLRERTLG